MKKDRPLKQHVALRATQPQKWLQESAIMVSRLIFGLLELSSTQWWLAICPLKIPRPQTCTKRSWVRTTRCQNFCRQNARISSLKFWTQILKHALEYKTFAATLSWSLTCRVWSSFPESQVSSLDFRRCPGTRNCCKSSLKTITSKRNTRLGVWKRTDTTTSQPLTI